MGHDAITNWSLLSLGQSMSEEAGENALPLQGPLSPRKTTTDDSEPKPQQRGRANSETAAQPVSLASTRK